MLLFNVEFLINIEVNHLKFVVNLKSHWHSSAVSYHFVFKMANSVVTDALCDIKSIEIYKNWWSKYEHFLQRKGKEDTLESIREYIVTLHTDNCAPATIWQCVSALSKRAEINGLPRVSKDSVITSLLKKWSKQHDEKKSATLRLEDFEKYLCSSEIPISHKCVAVIGFECALRGAELTALECKDVRYVAKDEEIRITVVRKKTTNKPQYLTFVWEFLFLFGILGK